MNITTKNIGSLATPEGVIFSLWAPLQDSITVVTDNGIRTALKKNEQGYFEGLVANLNIGDRYKYELKDGTQLPDPASCYQPEGPHGFSEVIQPSYPWTDSTWKGVSLSELVIYELHVGTYTDEGDFAALEKKIPYWQSLGINAIELMPVAQFAGDRNWGYDGVGLYATQNSYGGSEKSYLAFKKFVNSCHHAGIAVLLDVVYNHLGPEGNYLSNWGPYFHDRYKNPWGDALNFDGPDSHEVRNYFLNNARQWIEDFHLDGLRLDAIHAIIDPSAKPFIEELSELAESLSLKYDRSIHLIAETENSDPRILKPRSENGWGLSAHWADDFHHVIHTLLTKENKSYYQDYGELQQLAKVYERGLVFEGQYSKNRRRYHGRSYKETDRRQLVVCIQNHDQTGNRALGERLSVLVGEEKSNFAASCMFLTGALPMIFMGEERAARSPFLYFVSHTDKNLLKAVQKGRSEEFKDFDWKGDIPDPGSETTFQLSKISWQNENDPECQNTQALYKKLIEISKWLRQNDILTSNSVTTHVYQDDHRIEVFSNTDIEVGIYISLNPKPQTVSLDKPAAVIFDLATFPEVEFHAIKEITLKPFSVVLVRFS